LLSEWVNGPLCQKKEGGNIFSILHKVKTIVFSSRYKVSRLNVLEHSSLKKDQVQLRLHKLPFEEHHELKEGESDVEIHDNHDISSHIFPPSTSIHREILDE